MYKKILLSLGMTLIFLMMSIFSSAEIVIVNETEKDFYSLELVHVEGDLDDDELQIFGQGEIITGSDVKVYILGPAKDVVIKDVIVDGQNAPVSFDEKGYFIVVNEKGKFTFAGDMIIKKIGQIQLYVRGPINELTFDLEHGYPVNGNKYGVYDEYVTIQRSQKVSTLVEGNFKYTYEEQNSFYYIINFQSFGSTLGAYTLNLKNNEKIQTVTGVLNWEQTGNTLKLELESDRASVNIYGLFDSKSLKLPLSEGTHKVMIESDAEKKISISTGAKELDVSEGTIGTKYPNARVFMAKPYDVFTIAVKQLDLMPSLSATVNSASNKIAITKDGSIVGELLYNYANTGVDYIEIDSPGVPLYASTQTGPVKLTKDEKFLLAFPKSNYGRLEMVYFDTIPKLGLFEIIDVPLAKTDLPITSQTTKIFIPDDYYILETFGTKGGSEVPDIKGLLIYAIIIGGLAYLLIKKLKFAILFTIFSAGLFYFSKILFFMLLLLIVILIVKKYLKEKLKWGYIVAAGGILLGIFFVFMIGYFGLLSISSKSMDSVSNYAGERAMVEMDESMDAMKGLQTIGDDSEGAITVPTRTGVLPVKLQIPNLGKQITVTNHLVTKENPVKLKLVIVSKWLFIIDYLIAVIAGFFAFRIYSSENLAKPNTINKQNKKTHN